ncbi:hypothetical protein [Sporosarcina sp. FSL W7-1283]|uniref:hypothetical protein n=1 Tax=Sporosarcina sp. FSL W7-1283 TaxID=2921560 RepID=UPI0030FAC54B
MARKVRCIYCRDYGTDETFYRVRKDSYSNRFLYYCSEDEYKLDMENQRKKKEETRKYKDLMQYIMEDIYNYEKGMVFPTSLTRRIQKLREFYDYETIKSAFKHSKEAINWALNNKRFENEYNKTSYIMAIVNGNINDVYLNNKRLESQREIQLQREKSVDVGLFNETVNSNTPIKKSKLKDISSFLDESF